MSQLTAGKVAEMCEAFRGLSPHYRATLHSTMRAILRTIGAPPGAAAGVPRCQGTQPRETTVPGEEFEAALRQAQPACQIAMLLARDGALRTGTILSLKPSQLDWQRNEMQGQTKGGRRFTTPMTQRLRDKLTWAVQSCQNSEQTILGATRQNRAPYSIDAIHRQLARAKQRAGITAGWTFHDLRRTTARDLYTATHDIRKVQRLLSHVHLRTTLWYIGNAAVPLTGDEIAAAIQRGEICKEERPTATQPSKS